MASHKIATTREEQIEVERHRHCRHFLGLNLRERTKGNNPPHCAVGIPLDQVTTEGKPLFFLPCRCYQSAGAKECPKFQLMTVAEAEAIVEMHDQMLNRTLMAREAIVKHAGRWQKGQGLVGKIDCPVCLQPASLSYSRSGYNGHIHASCSTEGCVNWME